MTERDRLFAGRRLRELRVAAGMSARMLALRAGMVPTSIWNMENGTSPVSRSAMTKLARPLGLSYEELEERLFGGTVTAAPKLNMRKVPKRKPG